MNEHNRQIYIEEDEITLKELISKLQEFWGEIWKNKFLVPIISGLFAVVFLWKAWSTPATYPAELTFMVEEDEGGRGFGGVTSILGQFGFGGGGGGGKYNLDKILELAQSRKIISEVLFEKALVNGTNQFLANHLIDIYNFHEKWEEDTDGLKGYYFSNNRIDSFDRKDNKALKAVYKKVVGGKDVEGILKKGFGEDTGILFLNIKSESEDFSLHFVKLLYKRLSQFYILKTIEKQETTFKVFKAKVDSIQMALNDAQYKLLQFDDRNRALTLRQYSFKKQQLQLEVSKIISSYGEAYKNLEISELALKNKTPFITVIDEPIAPIWPSKESKTKWFLIGGTIGGFLIVLFLIGRKVVRDAME